MKFILKWWMRIIFGTLCSIIGVALCTLHFVLYTAMFLVLCLGSCGVFVFFLIRVSEVRSIAKRVCEGMIIGGVMLGLFVALLVTMVSVTPLVTLWSIIALGIWLCCRCPSGLLCLLLHMPSSVFADFMNIFEE